jgi:hypothetical protein
MPGQPVARAAATPAVNPAAPAGRPATELPSYPILLTDLPRFEAGQSVPPARSRLIILVDRDLDSSPPPLVPAPPARPTEPALRYVPSPAGSAAPLTAGHASANPTDTKYVP